MDESDAVNVSTRSTERIRTPVIDEAKVLVNVHATFSHADECVTLREGGNSCGNGATQKYQLDIIPFRCNNERAKISEQKRHFFKPRSNGVLV